jgi:hypothetical protein
MAAALSADRSQGMIKAYALAIPLRTRCDADTTFARRANA